jgi:hypothetical protein
VKNETISALVIGEAARTPSPLTTRMEARGCACEFAVSYPEARVLLKSRKYDLVLSPMRIGDSSMFTLLDLFKDSSSTLFYFVVIEDGYWWLPGVSRGQLCLGGNAFRPNEFIPVLDKAIDDLRVRPATLSPAR